MRYHFRDCELDEALRVLTRHGEEVPVQPKVLDLLLFLLRHRSRMVPKELLFRELWPDAIVTEASLTRLVKEARRAVGDDGRRQRVIRTAHRRGYRFVAEVEVRNGDDASEEERAIELARRSLEASVEFGALEVRERVREFAETCLVAIHRARRPADDGAQGVG
ncbi:MAG: winged helix-turn-helix domain-containing protein [Myxococcota bacterium]